MGFGTHPRKKITPLNKFKKNNFLKLNYELLKMLTYPTPLSQKNGPSYKKLKTKKILS